MFVTIRITTLYQAPHFAAPVLATVPRGTELAVEATEGFWGLATLRTGEETIRGWVPLESLERKRRPYWWCGNLCEELREELLARSETALCHPDYYVRQAALELLAQIQSKERLLGSLSRGVRDSTSTVRQVAMATLAELGEDAIPVWRQALENRDRAIRQQAMEMLQKLDVDQSLWEEMLFSDDRDVRLVVVQELRKRLPSSLPVLRQALVKGYADVQIAVAEVLADEWDREAIPFLRAMLSKALNPFEPRRAGGEISKASQPSPALHAAMKEEKRTLSEAAIKALGKLGDRESLPIFRQCLQHEDNRVCNAAIQALVDLGDAESAPLLRDLIVQPRGNVEVVILALAGLGDQQAIPLIEENLTRPSEKIRNAALLALTELKGEESLPKIERFLRDPGVQNRLAAVQALGKLGDKAIPLLESVLTQKDKSLRQAAMEQLCLMGDQAKPFLHMALRSSYWDVRLTAAKVLVKDSPGDVLPVIEEALKSGNNDDVIWAAENLDQFGDLAVPLLSRLFDHDSPDVQAAAVKTLSRMGEKAVPAWLVLLTGENAKWRRLAADHLAMLGEPGVNALATALKTPDRISPLGRIDAVKALISAGDPAKAPLQESLGSTDESTQLMAALVLGNLGDSEAEAHLRVALKDYDPEVRRLAIEGLLKIGDRKLPEMLPELLADSVAEVRWTAAAALAQCGEEGEILLRNALKEQNAWARETAARGLGAVGNKDNIPSLRPLLQDSISAVRTSAAQALLRLGWLPENMEAFIELIIAEQAWPVLELLRQETHGFLRAALNGDHCEWAAETLIRLGGQDTVDSLIATLEQRGTLLMAQWYLTSGQWQLRDAAQRWAESHQVPILDTSAHLIPAGPKWAEARFE